MGNYANVLLSLRLRKKAKIKGVNVQSVAKSTFLIFFECNELSRESLLSKKKKQYLSVFLLFLNKIEECWLKTWFLIFNFRVPVVILDDTCDSSRIIDIASGADVVVHEAPLEN